MRFNKLGKPETPPKGSLASLVRKALELHRKLHLSPQPQYLMHHNQVVVEGLLEADLAFMWTNGNPQILITEVGP